MIGTELFSEKSMNVMNGWANNVRAAKEELDEVQNGLPVRLIATERRVLSTCHPDELIVSVVQRDHEKYDHWPVENDDGRIVGLLNLAPFRKNPPSDCARQHMHPLDERNLMGADASVLSFIRGARS